MREIKTAILKEQRPQQEARKKAASFFMEDGLDVWEEREINFVQILWSKLLQCLPVREAREKA